MPSKPDDEELTLHYYGEHPRPEEIERALAADPELERRWRALGAELDALAAVEPPEPRAGLELRVWNRIAPELERRRGWTLFGLQPARLALVAAAALALVAGGFLAGRVSQAPAPEQLVATVPVATATPAALAPDSRDRLLAATLASHLDSSERLLVELANDGSGSVTTERRLAESLLESNRLYRLAAERAGQRRVAALLAELEPLFLELANAEDPGPEGSVAAARERLESRDLLFKVRVTRGRI